MSDYLNNILQRNISPTNVVRPRPRALFEPPPGQEKIGFPFLREGKHEDHSLPLTDMKSISEGEQQEHVIVQPELRDSQIPAQDYPKQPFKGSSVLQPKADRNERPLTSLIRPAKKNKYDQSENVKDTDNTHNTRLTEKPIMPEKNIPALQPKDSTTPKPDDPIMKRLTPKVEPLRELHIKPAVKSETAPTIRVTIGRIEVRAKMPPPSKTQRAAPVKTSPTLSLNDYLKQRSEGQ